ncbi:MAG: hypothetical protein B7C24_18270 [Bacteroidetes bacterium 4572_77]|nr:MAG: hypothetical protein B7C24_18270 [Bacteroidetes bacterium 4572_77]
MMRKKITLIISILIFGLGGFSQETFFSAINNETDLYCTDIIETTNNDFIVTSIGVIYGSPVRIQTHLYKMNRNGVLIDSLIISADKSCLLKKTLELDNGNYISWGSYQTDDPDVYDFWQIIFDNEFNILEEVFYPNDGGQVLKINSVIRENRNISIVVSFGTDANIPSRTDFFISEINQVGEIIRDSIFDIGLHNFTFDIDYLQTNNLYYLTTRNGFTEKTESEILVMDTNFVVVDKFNTWETEIGESRSINFLTDTTFLFSGNYRPNDKQKGNFLLGIYKYDTNFNELSHKYIGGTDTLRYSGVFNNLDFTDINNIYFGSTKNFLYDVNQWTSQPSWLQLDILNDDLAILKEKYYGGDAYYIVYYVLATSDGGAVLMATKYEHGDYGPYERDIVLLKVDENGLITSNNGELPIPIKNAIVLPNPGHDYLELHTAEYPSELLLYDINGKIVKSEEIHQNKTRINTKNLNSATYIWQVCFY